MKQYYIITIFLLTHVQICNAQEINIETDTNMYSTLENIKSEIEEISDFYSLKAYWQEIHDSDQSKRGCNSSFSNDVLNAYKTYLLLQKHGYPSVKDFGKSINLTPKLVNIHQGAFNTIELRNYLFSYIHKAWIARKITNEDMIVIACGIPCEYARKLHKNLSLPNKLEIHQITKECGFLMDTIVKISMEEAIVKIIQEKKDAEILDIPIYSSWSNEYHVWSFFIRDGVRYLKKTNLDCSFSEYKVVESKIKNGIRYDYASYHYDDYFIIKNNTGDLIIHKGTAKKTIQINQE